MKEATPNVTLKELYTSRHKSTASECGPEWKEALTINTKANDADIELKETVLNTKNKENVSKRQTKENGSECQTEKKKKQL